MAWVRRPDAHPLRTVDAHRLVRADQRAAVDARGSRGPLAAAVADRLVRDGHPRLFDAWCIADSDLAMMLQRLVANGDPVPARGPRVRRGAVGAAGDAEVGGARAPGLRGLLSKSSSGERGGSGSRPRMRHGWRFRILPSRRASSLNSGSRRRAPIVPRPSARSRARARPSATIASAAAPAARRSATARSTRAPRSAGRCTRIRRGVGQPAGRAADAIEGVAETGGGLAGVRPGGRGVGAGAALAQEVGERATSWVASPIARPSSVNAPGPGSSAARLARRSARRSSRGGRGRSSSRRRNAAVLSKLFRTTCSRRTGSTPRTTSPSGSGRPGAASPGGGPDREVRLAEDDRPRRVTNYAFDRGPAGPATLDCQARSATAPWGWSGWSAGAGGVSRDRLDRLDPADHVAGDDDVVAPGQPRRVG